MEINSSYNFSLKAPFGGYNHFTNTTIRGKVDLGTAISVDPSVVDTYQRFKYSLPESLKDLTLETEMFYIVSPSNGAAKTVIPVIFVAESSITKASVLTKTFTFTLDGPNELSFLKSLFSDNNINYK